MRTETDALKGPFLIGVLAVGIVVVILGGLISIFGSTDDRPEGIAERWLTAVGDTTRKGVGSDAEKRVSEHGDVALATFLVVGPETTNTHFDYDGKSAFESLEVGKATRPDANTALVPAMVHYRNRDELGDVRFVLELNRDGDSWRVTRSHNPDAALKVPSDGGDVASKAPVTLYLVGLVIGFGVAAAASALVRTAGREHELLLDA